MGLISFVGSIFCSIMFSKFQIVFLSLDFNDVENDVDIYVANTHSLNKTVLLLKFAQGLCPCYIINVLI